MSYYKKKIIITPVKHPPHPKDLAAYDHIPSTNINFTASYNQEYIAHRRLKNMDEYINDLKFNVRQGIAISNNTVNLNEFEFKPKLKINSVQKNNIFNDLILNNTSQKKSYIPPQLIDIKLNAQNNNDSKFLNRMKTEKLQNETNYSNELISQKENICYNPPIPSTHTELNTENNLENKLQNGNKVKKFKFDKYKNNYKISNSIEVMPEKEISHNSYLTPQYNLEKHVNPFHITRKLNSVDYSAYELNSNTNKATFVNIKYKSNFKEFIESNRNNRKNNFIRKDKLQDIPKYEPSHSNRNTPNSEDWFSNIPEELEHILDNSSHNSDISNYSKLHEDNIKSNILDPKIVNKIDHLSNLFPNNSENDLNNKVLQNNNDQLLFDSEIQNIEPSWSNKIQTKILDLKLLHKIDDLTNLFPNNSEETSNTTILDKKKEDKLSQNLDSEISDKIKFANTSALHNVLNQSNNSANNVHKKNKNVFLDSTATKIDCKAQNTNISSNITNNNSQYKVSDSKENDSKINKFTDQTLLRTEPQTVNENTRNDIKSENVINKTCTDILRNSKRKKILQNSIVDTVHKNKSIENIKSVPETKTLSNINQITLLSINHENEQNKKYEENKSKTDLKFKEKFAVHSTSNVQQNELIKNTSKEILNNIKPIIPVNANKQTKTIKRKCYELEINKTCYKPPLKTAKTFQTKITTLLKPIEKSPDLEKKKPEKKKYNCNLISCTELTGGKRKITDHFQIIKGNESPEDKELKTSNTRNLLVEKKQVPKFKKNKFVIPVLKQESQVPQVNKYEICPLDDDKLIALEDHLSENNTDEIAFNVIFKENCCLLSQEQTGFKTYNPNGILIHISWTQEIKSEKNYPAFYYMDLSKPLWKDISIPRSLLKKCFSVDCKKICFKAQSLIILLVDIFSFSINEIELNWLIIDPFIGCWLLDPDHPPSTFSDVQTQLRTKDSAKIFGPNVLDNSCDMLIRLSSTTKKLRHLLEEKNLWNIFVNVEIKVLTILSGMEFCGIMVDIKILKEFGIILKEKLEIIEKKAYESVGRVFQINSTVQLRSILYDELKLDVKNNISIQQTSSLGAKSTSEPMLQLLQKVHPLPGLVLEYRHLSKVKSTYVDAMIQHVQNGIIYSTWEQTSAATGRIASSNPNLQAIPKQPFPLTLFPENNEENKEAKLHLRSAYISRPGYSLVAADFHHIELRVFAHLSQDKTIIKALNEPGDIFVSLTKTWLGNNTEEISKKQREETKRLVYATMYGAGPSKIAGILKIPLCEASTIIQRFTNKFPSLKEFSRSTIELCQKQCYLRSLSGRCRLFPNINNPIFKIKAQSERQAINFRIQGSAADICKSAMIATQEHLKEFDCKLLLQIHDELVWEVLDEYVPVVQDIVKKVMEDTYTICGQSVKFSVPLPVSVSVGKNWGEMKE